VCAARPAHAEETLFEGSGAVGGALLGAEAVLLTEALAGVRPTWAYWLGALGGAALGGYVGWRIEERTRPEVSGALLGAGVVFVFPTAVWFGNLHAPRPPTYRAESRSAKRSAR
jgi:hypothetical protein